MLRIALYYVLPFLLPFIGFFLYRFLVTRGQSVLAHTPWFVLTLVGLLLVISTLLTLAFGGGGEAGADYVPPHLEGGRIVPGELLPQPPADATATPPSGPTVGDDAAAGNGG